MMVVFALCVVFIQKHKDDLEDYRTIIAYPLKILSEALHAAIIFFMLQLFIFFARYIVHVLAYVFYLCIPFCERDFCSILMISYD